MVAPPHQPRPSEAGEHLVGDQERLVLARDRLERREIARRRNDVARGALDGLDDDRRDLATGLILDDVAHVVGAGDAALGVAQPQRAAIAVGVRRRVLAGQERPQPVLEVAAEESQHAAGLAVEAAPEADDFVLARRRLGQAQGRLHRLGAAREELDAREAVGREAREQLEQLRAGLGGKAAKGQLLDLALEALDVVRMAVADTAHADASDEIDVRVAVHVGERAALAAGHGQPRVEREGLQPGRDVTLLALEDLTRARPDFAATVAHRDTAANRRAR